MTKSQQPATKHQYSRLFRWLGILSFIKLSIFAFLLLDFPLPSISEQPQVKTTVRSVEQPHIQPVQPAELNQPPKMEVLPQGAEAAKLAATINPSRRQQANSVMPAPIIASNTLARPQLLNTSELPLPAPLPTPVAEAGVSVPFLDKDNVQENPILDIASAKKLPVPSLGSISVAHAAVQSMPVPQTPSPSSTFMPSEQNISGQNINPSMPVPDVSKDLSPSSMSMEVQELARQQQDVLMLRKQMDNRLQELRDSEDKVKKMLDEAKVLENDKIHTLVLMYNNMKPKTAAQALENMNEHVAVQILQGMTPKQAGEILSYTNPTVTAKLTELLTHMRLPE